MTVSNEKFHIGVSEKMFLIIHKYFNSPFRSWLSSWVHSEFNRSYGCHLWHWCWQKQSSAWEGNRIGRAIFKNRLYLRKKSFFERFFAHKTGKDRKKYINDKVTATSKLDISKASKISVQNWAKWTEFKVEFKVLFGAHHKDNTEAFHIFLRTKATYADKAWGYFSTNESQSIWTDIKCIIDYNTQCPSESFRDTNPFSISQNLIR